MNRILKFLAASVALAALATWLATGANRGWTKTSVQTESIEPVTEMRVLHEERKFLPGVDFLAVVFGGATALFGASFFFRKTNTKTNQSTNN